MPLSVLIFSAMAMVHFAFALVTIIVTQFVTRKGACDSGNQNVAKSGKSAAPTTSTN